MLLNTACEHLLGRPGTPEAQALGLSRTGRQLHASAACLCCKQAAGSRGWIAAWPVSGRLDVFV